MLDLDNRPGSLFVVATLLPLASFTVLLLIGWVRNALRKSPEESLGEKIYQALGGDTPPRWPAYIATAAIGGAFLCSLTGAILYLADNHGHADSEEVVKLKEEIRDLEKDKPADWEKTRSAKEADLLSHLGNHDKIHYLEHRLTHVSKKDRQPIKDEIHRLESRWEGSADWIRLSVGTSSDYERAGSLQVGFKIDSLSALMFVMVTFIATLIHVFSTGYMSEEEQKIVEDHHVHAEEGHLHRRGRFGRFFMYLSLFCFSMLNLVLADNLFQVFVSWELVGICSYLLIGFYYERQSASNASNKAFITNRVGDAGFILGLLICWTFVGTLNFDELFARVRSPIGDTHADTMPQAGQFVRGKIVAKADDGTQTLALAPSDGDQLLLWPSNLEKAHFHAADFKPLSTNDANGALEPTLVEVATEPGERDWSSLPYWMLVVAGLGIFLGCVGKSAQFPLSVWLPDAMEGPTPVSALIHAATMVAAGVYLVGRCYPLFTSEVLLVIAYTGVITLFVAATIAIVATDIKKVLAYSTVSQLGYMMLALGVGGWTAGLFHLVTHAFFKALLFLCSGSVIYGCHHEQDMRKMGGLYPKMKITALTMLMGVLAISGIPGFSGWYSKDAVLAACIGFARVHPEHALLFIAPLLTAGITTFYMFRMWFMTFTGEPKDHHVYEHAHESPRAMTVPLMALAVFSVIVAWGWPFFSSHFPFIDPHSSWLEHQLHHAQPASVLYDFGTPGGENWDAPPTDYRPTASPRYWAGELGHTAGNLALLAVAFGLLFALLLYYYKTLDPAEAKAQFPRLYTFLERKWYFDELYSALLVQPTMVLAHYCRLVDNKGIDLVIDTTAKATVGVARFEGKFDNSVIDGLVNVIARVCYAIGSSLRNVQTGYLRSYVLFLVLAAVGLFLLLSYFVSLAMAG